MSVGMSVAPLVYSCTSFIQGQSCSYRSQLDVMQPTSTANSHIRRLQSDLAMSGKRYGDIFESHVFLAMESHGTHRSRFVSFGLCRRKLCEKENTFWQDFKSQTAKALPRSAPHCTTVSRFNTDVETLELGTIIAGLAICTCRWGKPE